MSTAPIPEGAIVIHPSEVYAEVRSLTDAVTKMLAQKTAEDVRAAEDRGRLTAVEARQSTLEKKVWLIAGLCAGGGGTAGSVVAQYLTK